MTLGLNYIFIYRYKKKVWCPMKIQVDRAANLTQKWSQNHMKGFKHDYNNIIKSSSTKKSCHEFYSSYRRNCLSFFGNGNLLRSSSLVSCRILSLQAFWRVDTERQEKIYHQNNNHVNIIVYNVQDKRRIREKVFYVIKTKNVYNKH